MTRLDLSRLPPYQALALARRLLRFAPEGLEAVVAHPGRVLVYVFGPPWPGGRGRGARPLQVYRLELGPPGESCPLHLPTPPPREEPKGSRLPLRRWRDPGSVEGVDRLATDELLRPWNGRV